ncbi:MAG: hypothetical protein KIT33_06700 [Candidatus Kapabacteria bacterium]|nr:hypothetical protein [Ignavibacteriota bacterium]MCW5884644.1 hypothetical protein [Candidatus Kapabacteria bacterium]
MIKLKSLLIFTLAILISANTDIYSEALINFGRISGSISEYSTNGLNLERYISARRGGSFRGSRSRSSSRSSSRSTARSAPKTNPQKTPSFGGKRMSSQQAQAKYGTPRRVQPMQGQNAAGSPVNYNVHHYGGFSSSLMTGYMMGNMAWWMMMPAMMYSRPVYVEKEDGQIDVYPPSFDWGKLFMILAIIAVVVYFIRNARRAKNQIQQGYSNSSFS